MVLVKRIIKLVISILFLPLICLYFLVKGRKRCVALTYHSIKDPCKERFRRQIEIISKTMHPVSIRIFSMDFPQTGVLL